MRRHRAFMTVLAGGVSDAIAPSVVITCTQSSPSSATTLNFTITFSEPVTGFVVGDFVVTNGTKGALGGSGAVYTCDVTPTGMSVVTANVAAGVAVDAAGNSNTVATQLSITSTAPFSDAFTRSDGAIGSIWTGSTWTISSNAALNTPALGAEKITNGTMEADANWPNSGTPVTNERSTEQVHGGTYSRKVGIDAQYEGITGTSYASTAGVWYLWLVSVYGNGTKSIIPRVAGGSADYYMWGSSLGSGFVHPASWSNGIRVFLEAYNQNLIPQHISSTAVTSGTSYIDDFSIKPITFSSIIATLPDVGVASITANVVITVDPGATQAGHILNIDNLSNPQNFILAYIQGDNMESSTRTAKLYKCVSGTYTQVISGTITYNAAHNLKVVKNGDNYSLYYGATGSETQVGTTQAVTGMSGTIHGLFSTYSTAKFDSYSINP